MKKRSRFLEGITRYSKLGEKIPPKPIREYPDGQQRELPRQGKINTWNDLENLASPQDDLDQQADQEPLDPDALDPLKTGPKKKKKAAKEEFQWLAGVVRWELNEAKSRKEKESEAAEKKAAKELTRRVVTDPEWPVGGNWKVDDPGRGGSEDAKKPKGRAKILGLIRRKGLADLSKDVVNQKSGDLGGHSQKSGPVNPLPQKKKRAVKAFVNEMSSKRSETPPKVKQDKPIRVSVSTRDIKTNPIAKAARLRKVTGYKDKSQYNRKNKHKGQRGW